MSSPTRQTEIKRLRKASKRGQKRKKRNRKYGTTPKLLPTK